MKCHQNCKRIALTTALGLGLIATANAQVPDMAAAAKWESATIIHYEAVGEVTETHVQIPPVDADLYADVTDKVSLSFDWDKNEQTLVGALTFQNYPGTTTKLFGMGEDCPTGSLSGAYEHFDIVSVKINEQGLIELTGKRVHPDTMVAESCGTGLRPYKGGDEAVTEYITAPDPTMLAFGSMLPPDGPVSISPDGTSMILKSLNNGWVWTFTPSVK
ncbi:MAG: hypothetical protein V4628_10285 [Pseudomonadota bacterium]